jgi:hypothetical protein
LAYVVNPVGNGTTLSHFIHGRSRF